MGFAEAIRVALQSLWANKLRTVLTVIGVVIGVASVIAVITLANGANMFVVKKIASHGSDTLTVSRLPAVIFTGEEYLKVNKRKNITYDDYLYLQRTWHPLPDARRRPFLHRKGGQRQAVHHRHHHQRLDRQHGRDLRSERGPGPRPHSHGR